MDKVFTNQSEAKNYVLQQLSNKYQKSFRILEKDDFRDKGYIQTYVCRFKDDITEDSYFARAIQNGVIEDNYALSYYRKEADELWVNSVQSIESFTLQYDGFDAPITSACWKGEESFNEYCNNAKVFYKVIIRTNNGINQEIFVHDFMNFQNDCKKLMIPVECKILDEDEGDTWIKLGDTKKKTPYLSEDELKMKLKMRRR